MGIYFVLQLKAKTNLVRFLSNSRHLNIQLKHKIYPMSKICEIPLKLYILKYTTSLYLSTGYYYIHLREEAINLCTIILPWVKYRYKRLPMGARNSLDIFQDKMKKMFQRFEFIRAYINVLFIIN